MNDILLRIRRVFKESGKSQTDIGKLIDKTPQYVWRIMNVDDLNPSKSVLKSICRALGVNEDWLRTGEGDPYIKRTRNQEIATFMNDVMDLPDEAFKKEFIDRIRRLDEKDWEAIANIVDKLLKER